VNERLTDSTPVGGSTPITDTPPISNVPPIPEARGPHLPDAVTRLSPWVIAFVAVAIVQVWFGFRAWSGQFAIPQPDNVPLLAHYLVPSAIVPLFGAALFVRHPDARRTMPALVFGLVLLTIVQLLASIDAPLRAFLDSLSSPDDGPVSPANVAYAVFRSLLQLFAILYIAGGLAEARRVTPSAAQRPLALWLGALAVAGTVISIASVAQFGLDLSGPGGALVLAIDIALALFTSIVWAYLVAVTVGGVLAGDAPKMAWRLAALGAAIIFVFRLLAGIVLGVGDPWTSLVLIGGYVALAGWLLLLVAFWLGLPVPADPAPADAAPADAAATADPPTADDEPPTADPPATTPTGSGAG
jgi:hypothetical protein